MTRDWRVGILTVSDRAFAWQQQQQQQQQPSLSQEINNNHNHNNNGNDSTTFYEDQSGPAIEQWLRESRFPVRVVSRRVVADDISMIREQLLRWTDGPFPMVGNGEDSVFLHCILTTGGTGFSARDQTPEAVGPLLHKWAHGLQVRLVTESMRFTPLACLSRPCVGIRNNRTLIITLPGSPKACRENLSILEPVLGHAMDLILQGSSDTVFQRPLSAPSMTISQESGKDVAAPSPEQSASLVPHACSSNHSHGRVTDRDRVSAYPLMELEDAIHRLQLAVTDVGQGAAARQIETLALSDRVMGRVLAADVYSTGPVPRCDVSLVDGYAVSEAVRGPGTYPVAGSVTAGQLNGLDGEESVAQPHHPCLVRISTGAPVPSGCHAVVMVEDTMLREVTTDGAEEARVEIRAAVSIQSGLHIRRAGSDIAAGSLLLPAGHVLSASSGDLGYLVSANQLQVECFALPRVVLFSTGNEIRDILDGHVDSHQLATGTLIWDANRPALKALLAGLAEVFDEGIIPDNLESVWGMLEKAFQHAHVIITTGGVSMGERDFVKAALKRVGASIEFGRVRMKPGEGGAKKFFFGLPGNPVSALVCFHVFVRPLLQRLGGRDGSLSTILVKLAEPISLDPDRPEFHRVFVRWRQDPATASIRAIAYSTGSQQSSRLGSMVTAKGLLKLPAGKDHPPRTHLPADSVVECILIEHSPMSV